MRRRSLAGQVFTQLNAHIAVVAVLLIFDLVLATRLAVAWHESHSDQSAQYNADLNTYAQLKAQGGHLQALPAQLSDSRRAQEMFVNQRMAANDSDLLKELGALKDKNHVRLSRATYTFAPAVPGLVEQRLEANVSGQYTAIMHFINDMERDKNHVFFIIRSITLTGQQGGTVNLRVRLTTYMRTDAATAVVLQPANRTGESAGSEETQ